MATITITLGDETDEQLLRIAAAISALAGRGTAAPAINQTVEQFARREPTGMRGGDTPLVHADDDAGGPVDHSDKDATLLSGASASDEQHAMAGAPATDSNGTPWDERIHSASRATIADGTWRRRKNTPDEVFASVMAELNGKSAPAVSDAGLSHSTALANTAPPAPASETPVAPPPPPVETPAPPPAAPAPAASSEPMTFPQFVQAVQAKDVPVEKKAYKALNDLAVTIGVPAFKDMKDHADKFELFLGMME